MIKLSNTAKEKLKIAFRDLMITTMDYCIESKETQNKSIEVFSIIANDIKRELKQDEIEKISKQYIDMAINLVAPNSELSKKINYDMFFSFIEGVINNG